MEEWGLKVQKLASVHSVTLLFVSNRIHMSLPLFVCGWSREVQANGGLE